MQARFTLWNSGIEPEERHLNISQKRGAPNVTLYSSSRDTAHENTAAESPCNRGPRNSSRPVRTGSCFSCALRASFVLRCETGPRAGCNQKHSGASGRLSCPAFLRWSASIWDEARVECFIFLYLSGIKKLPANCVTAIWDSSLECDPRLEGTGDKVRVVESAPPFPSLVRGRAAASKLCRHRGR